MHLSLFQKLTFGAAGATALGIGGVILIAPDPFYQGYAISLGDNPSLLSELRAPAAGLVVLGGTMLAGLVRRGWSQLAFAAALIVFIAWPLGRIVGIVADGLPSDGILGALGLELLIGALLVLARWPFAGRFLRSSAVGR